MKGKNRKARHVRQIIIQSMTRKMIYRFVIGIYSFSERVACTSYIINHF